MILSVFAVDVLVISGNVVIDIIALNVVMITLKGCTSIDVVDGPPCVMCIKNLLIEV